MGALGAALAAAAGAIAKTVSNANKKKSGGTSSGGSSGSGRSSGKTTSSGGSGRSSGKTIEQYQADYNAAKAKGDQAGMDAAHAGAEAIRAQQGYRGGADGSQHISLGSSGSTGSTTSGTSGGSSGSSSGRKFYSGQYDQNLDYKALADEAARNGNMAQAAIYEQMRNQKITDQNLGYALTNQYAQYLGQTAPNGISSAFDKTNNRYDLSNSSLTSKNTGAGKGVTAIEPGYIGWNAGYTQDFQSYIDQDTKWIQEYEKALENPNLTDKMRKLYQSHLVAAYNDRAEQEQNRNAKLYAMGRPDLMTDLYQDQGNGTKGWLQDFSSVGNGAKSLSAGYIYSQEQLAARLENAFQNATSDAEREVIWRDLAPIERQLGRAYDAKTGQFSATTVSATRDHYGKKANAAGYSYGALTNGAVNTDADRALLAQGLQAAKDERDAAAANGMYTPEWYLSNMPNRESGQANDPTRYNGLTEEDYKALYMQAKANGDKAGMESAHAGAQAIRAQQGYDGGADGSKRIPLGSSGTTTGGSKLTSVLNLPGGKLAAGGIALGTLGAALAAQAAQGGTGGASGTATTTGGSTGSSSGGSSGGSYNYNNGSSGSTGSSSGGSMLDQYNQAYEDALKSLMQGQEAAKQQIELGVQQNVNNLESQKSEINAQLDKSNAEAEKLYMDAINPNGAIANQLAAMGLRDSGLTESSIISAGNTLQNNINANKREVASQIAKVDLAITNAQLEGNMQIAGVLADYAKAVADMGMTNASNVLSFQQWAAEFEESRKYNQAQLEMAQQQLAMQERQLAQQQAQAQWEREQAEKNWQMQQEQWAAQQQQNRVDNQQYQREYVYKLIANGTLPSHETIVNAGMTDAEVYDMWKNVKAQMAAGY